ncbi:MAG TPA: hypothetical protein ENH29_01550, partial [Bacteroidetes bacterium]|nr:hypothetical protein [Bacteroidota bacterium]
MIHNSLTKSIIRTHQRCAFLGNSAEEPDFIADLTLNWTQELHTILKLILHPKLQIGLASVYCHQKPIVDFGQAKNPELGDILFVFKYTDLYGKTTINSLLLQVKKTSRQNFKISSNELHQLELYTKWPKFKYLRANALNGKTIDIHPKCVTQGARYLLIDPDPFLTLGLDGTFAFGCAIPDNLISIYSDFTNEILNFLMFATGRTISDKASITEDWSKMIWDLLSISKNKMT